MADDENPWEDLGVPPEALPESMRPRTRAMVVKPVYQHVVQAEPEVEMQVEEEPAQPELEPVPEGMSEIEKRLQKANLYQQWTTGQLYDSRTQCTVEVEQEFKNFALKQLNKLIGINVEQEQVQSQFEPEELEALKALAQAIIANKKLKQEVIKTSLQPKPIVKKPIAVKPIIQAEKPVIQPQAKPKLKTKPLPIEVQPTKQPVLETNKNNVSPPKSLVQAATAKKPFFAKDGEEIEESGKKYRAKWIQINSYSYGRAEQARLEKMAPKSIMVVGGLTIYKTESDELYSIIKQDLTPKETPVDAVPFPSRSQMTMITQMRASSANEQSKNVLVSKMGK